MATGTVIRAVVTFSNSCIEVVVGSRIDHASHQSGLS